MQLNSSAGTGGFNLPSVAPDLAQSVMKTTLLLSAGFALASTLAASAGDYPLLPLGEALELRDESRVSVEGSFVERHRGEEDEFVFAGADGGTVVVYDRREGRDIEFGVPVVLFGEVDQGLLGRTEIILHRVAPAVGSGEDSAATVAPPLPGAAAVGADDGLLIHVSSGPDAPRRVLMALTLAAAFVDSNPVLVYFDLDGVAVVAEGAENVRAEGYEPSRDRIRSLVEQGALLRACPTCLRAAGWGEGDLVEGVGLADKSEFLSFAQGRILTFDY